jgi:hypothetical protein
LVNTRPSSLRPTLQLIERGRVASELAPEVRTSITLGALEQRKFELAIELRGELALNQSAAVEAELLRGGNGENVVGSLGVLLLPRGER